MNYEGEKFLLKLYKALDKSEKVERQRIEVKRIVLMNMKS